MSPKQGILVDQCARPFEEVVPGTASGYRKRRVFERRGGLAEGGSVAEGLVSKSTDGDIRATSDWSSSVGDRMHCDSPNAVWRGC